MKLTARDRKILLLIVPLALLGAFWFLLLAPKREEAQTAKAAQAKAEQRHREAESDLNSATAAKAEFASDYAQVVRLGKAAPTSADVPSLIVQLQDAARGTGVRFDKIAVGKRASASATAGTPAAGAGSKPAASGGAAKPAAGAAAQGAAPKGAPAAGGAQSGAPGGAAASGSGAQTGKAGSGVTGLDSMPVEFRFRGDFFDLADFFHRMKRFVDVANGELLVTGRLVDVNGVTFDTTDGLHADIKATIYLAPEAEGVTAGASPAGPAGPAAPAAAATPATTPPAPATAAVTR